MISDIDLILSQPTWAEIQADQVAEVPDEEEIPNLNLGWHPDSEISDQPKIARGILALPDLPRVL